MNHNAVGTGISKGKCSGEGVLHTTLKNEALNARDNHEVVGQLNLFTCGNLCTKILNGCLRLFDLSAKQGILLKAGLILNDDSGNAHALQRTHVVDKVFRQAAGISVKNDGFGGDFHNVINGTQTGGHIHKLNVGLTALGAVAKRADPHAVKLIKATIVIHNGLLGNKAGKPIMSLNDLNRRRDGKQLPQATAAIFRHGQFLAKLLVNFARLLASGIWHLYERSAVCGEKPLNVVTDGAFGTVLPVVAMYYVIGL